MDLDRSPSKIAGAAAEEIRALNHRSLDAGAFEQPGDVSETADGLYALVQRLPQSLEQLSAGLRALEEQQKIRMDDGSDVTERVGEVLRALLDAGESLGVARSALRRASGPLSHMGGFFDEADGGA